MVLYCYSGVAFHLSNGEKGDGTREASAGGWSGIWSYTKEARIACTKHIIERLQSRKTKFTRLIPFLSRQEPHREGHVLHLQGWLAEVSQPDDWNKLERLGEGRAQGLRHCHGFKLQSRTKIKEKMGERGGGKREQEKELSLFYQADGKVQGIIKRLLLSWLNADKTWKEWDFFPPSLPIPGRILFGKIWKQKKIGEGEHFKARNQGDYLRIWTAATGFVLLSSLPSPFPFLFWCPRGFGFSEKEGE